VQNGRKLEFPHDCVNGHTGQATLPVEREKEQQQCVLVQEGKENLERDNGVVSIRGCGNLTGRLEAITGY